MAGVLVLTAGLAQVVQGTEASVGDAPATAVIEPQGVKPFFIGEFRVKGAHALKPLEIETAVYPFLGPGRTEEDVKAACAALEKVYRDKGYSLPSVQYAAQLGKGGVVMVQVAESTVARLRVKGARYFSPAQIKAEAPSLAEGKAVNFNEVKKDMIALSQSADRRVTPTLKPGEEPGTFDVDLEVQDKLPVHASVDLNNRHGPDTSALRLNATVSASNLWQRGHAASLSYQTSPQKPKEVAVYSGFYLARFPSLENFSLMLQGVKQNSNVSTLGDTAVTGRGETYGAHATIVLPAAEAFYHSFTAGMDFKYYHEKLRTGGVDTKTPITSYPFSVSYNATWIGKHSTTEGEAGVNFHFRGMGSDSNAFNRARSGADGGYAILTGSLSRRQDLPAGFELFARAQGQLANQPLLSSEKISGGGVGTVRGYLEAEATGDQGAFASVELRSPSLFGLWNKKNEQKPADGKPVEVEKTGEWRWYTFGDWGVLGVSEALAEEKARFELVSVGLGTRIKLYDHFSGSLEAGVPLKSLSRTKAHDMRILFRAGVDY